MSAGAEPPRAVIFGCAGTRLSGAERAFFAAVRPLGLILFARNCRTPDQVRALVAEFRETVGWAEAPVLIDQEGGRVQRLVPPHWRADPPAASFGALATRDPKAGERAAGLLARAIAGDLAALGITVNTAPVLDLQIAGQNRAVVGDRAFAADPDLVARLGAAVCAGLLAGGVLPVLKHAPGHGRATVDSHESLPVVDTRPEDLEASDFVPFRALAVMPLAMTAHILYTRIDPDRPATLSPAVLRDIIRGRLGFQGLLMSDDLCMGALGGTPGARARQALAAGCDIALHCNGRLAEMQDVAAAARPISDTARQRLGDAERLRLAQARAGAETMAAPDRLRAEMHALLGRDEGA
ncbi:MAG: beta-N-acetylhexosaminidase [Alphaproteobacteria bacterium]|nr:beta-N-acetylhexosaminidase [Alphaproteobacteria bacterium]